MLLVENLGDIGCDNQVLKNSCKIICMKFSFSLKKPLVIRKKYLSLPHVLAGSKVRMICRRAQPGA